MNTPSPLVPQGTKPAKNKSTIRIAFFTILIVHVIFIGGLLIQGCSKDSTPASDSAAKPTADTAAPVTDPAALPADATAPAAATPDATAATAAVAAPVNPVTTTTAPAAITPAPLTAPISAAPAPQVATGATHEYTIQKGDMLSTIAKKNGVSLKALQDANPGLNALRLQIGQKVQIPSGSAVASTAAASSADTTSADSGVYTVKSGDRLYNIAKSHGTTVKAIAALNGLKSVNSLKVGQKLKMPMAKSTSSDTAPVSTPAPAASATPTTTALAPTGQANN